MSEREKKKNITYTYDERLIITPEECPRIWFGELTERDFSTSHPNPYRIDNIARGINAYLKYKKKNM